MTFKEIIKLIYQKKWLIFWLTVLGAVLFFDLMVIQAPQYKTSSKILVIQKQVAGQDIYSISKSAQYLCRVLKEGIYSDSFFDKVFQSDYQIEVSDFPSQLKERRKQWQKTVKAKIVRDLGVIEIEVFYPDKEKAEQISWAITDVLKKEHRFYHGGGENVKLRVLDKPLVSEKPLSLQLWLGSILGALIGFFIGLVWVLGKTKKDVSLEEAFNREVSSLDRSNSSI
jgi:capsular polysaccharide biosynthesis protein